MTVTPFVTVIGDALIDELRDQTGSRSFAGGAALNVAVGLRILGVPTTLVAMVGDDADGDVIREYLAHFGVTLLATIAPNGSSRAISDRANGEPRYEFNSAAKNRRIDFDQAQKDAIAAAEYVVVTCFPLDSDDQAAQLRELIENPERRLIVDPNPRAGMLVDRRAFVTNFERLSSRALLTKIGDDDAALLYGADIDALTATLVSQTGGAILATAGSRGATVVTASGLSVGALVAELPGPIVDTMGAGDAVLASVTHSLFNAGVPNTALNWREVLETAMLVAAATCREEGALLRLPHGGQPSLGSTTGFASL